MLHCVITTIQQPTSSVRTLARRIAGDGHLIVAGDTKGPATFDLSDVTGFRNDQLSFLSIEDQLASDFRLAQLLPTKHYSRKNLGYLHAIRAGATCIYETDDDNAPLDTWAPRSEYISSATKLSSAATEKPQWVNVYRHFSDQNIWPRGLPLDQIHTGIQHTADDRSLTDSDGRIWAPIQQGLADGSPDVDAIWRLVLDREFTFNAAPSVVVPPGQWCPFNTQTTWWWPVVYPLLYVPSFCSFRMCDIWKSFVAQRCLWEFGTGVVFHAPEVWQERNVHNLMRDFNDEIPGYQQNHHIAEILEGVSLQASVENVGNNLKQCYQALIESDIFHEKEMTLVNAWLLDIQQSFLTR
ncbi:MAG: STELLO glycosyltransferase family protein [Planctomycetaceae bacterium]